ncbi:MAG: glycosyltransferase family A protein [Limnohabitans sp.]|nr:glycosyltransferase family A protein [Limnohabitans sp.]
MLSVLIPTYNYNTIDLVKEIHNQCETEGIIYEVLVLDDGSTNIDIIAKNDKINELTNCRFEKNKSNQGRATNMNLLSQKACYSWLLFLDCDTFPREKNFIRKYVENFNNESKKVFFGGICYKSTIPAEEEILRWKYGKCREEITVEKRKSNPYQTTLTSNLLIHKSIFEKITFEEKIKEYGYEDFVFIENLKRNNFLVEHIDNCTFHLNYENSNVFLKKTEKAIETLAFIEKHELTSEKTKVQKAYGLLSKIKLVWLFRFFFKLSEKLIYRNLTSKNPSILLFDIFKLGIYLNLKQSH